MRKKKYLTTSEAAKMIGCSAATLYNYHNQGVFVPELVYNSGHRRYSVEQVEHFVKERVDVK